MKLVAMQEDLAAGLQAAGRSVAVRSTLPVLTGIYLEAHDEYLLIRGTNMEIGLECTVPASVERTGSIVLPARHLIEMIRKIPPGAVEMEVSPEALRVEVRWGRSRFTIHGFSADDFPSVPEPAGYGGMPFSQAALKKAIRQTAFCVSTDSSRNSLTGVNFSFSDDSLRAISTDGYRIAVKECPLVDDEEQESAVGVADVDDEAGGAEGDVGGSAVGQSQSSILGMDDDSGIPMPADSPFHGRKILIPASSLNELARNLDDRPGSQGILYLVDKDAYFDLGRTKFYARLVEGKFPNVLAILPAEYVTRIDVGIADLQVACERVLLIAQTQDRILASRIRLERENLIITSDRPDVGRSHEEIDARVEGELMQVYFNPRFLIEGLRHLEGERCLIELSGTETPSRMTVPGAPDFQYIVMPIKVG